MEDFENYASKMDELVSKIEAEDPYCTLLTGDFNAHLNDWWDGDEDDTYGIRTNQFFCENGFTQLVNQPTYITGTGKTCIDLVATDQPNFIMECDIHPSLHTNCHHNVNFVKLNVSIPLLPLITGFYGTTLGLTKQQYNAHYTITTGLEIWKH